MNLIVYPALNGDCILMQTDGGNNILVDGGYVETYKHFLRPKLCEIQHIGENIDLVITTHIDSAMPKEKCTHLILKRQ